jgi:hypothetical protein
MTAREEMLRALNRLAKWRFVFASRMFGSRPDTDEPTKVFKDLVERTLILRAEVTALTALLVEQRMIYEDDFARHVAVEAGHLERLLEQQFPGFRSAEHGMEVYDTGLVVETAKNWPP